MITIKIDSYELDNIETALVIKSIKELKHNIYQEYRYVNTGRRAGKATARNNLSILGDLIFRLER